MNTNSSQGSSEGAAASQEVGCSPSEVPPQIHSIVPFEVGACTALGAHASARVMWRVKGKPGESAVLVFNRDIPENRAFIEFARHFRDAGINVPEILGVSESEEWYCVQDLGDDTLLGLLLAGRTAPQQVPDEVLALYERALRVLPQFQVVAGSTLNYDHCHQSARFDLAGMRRDLDACQRDFFDRIGLLYNREALATAWGELLDWLGEAPSDYFMFRDFQGRNIMFHEGELWFIDFQGGRRGPLQYDVVSLLFQSRAALTAEQREHLREVYLESLAEVLPVDKEQFIEYLDGFALLRVLQVLSVYGREGLGAGKEYFRQGIRPALAQLSYLLTTPVIQAKVPYLYQLTRPIKAAVAPLKDIG